MIKKWSDMSSLKTFFFFVDQRNHIGIILLFLEGLRNINFLIDSCYWLEMRVEIVWNSMTIKMIWLLRNNSIQTTSQNFLPIFCWILMAMLCPYFFNIGSPNDSLQIFKSCQKHFFYFFSLILKRFAINI